MSEIKKIENGKVEIICTIDGEQWKDANKKAFKKILNKLQIKGFRKGQVPQNLAKKYVTDKEVQYDAANTLCEKEFEEAIKEHDVELIDKVSFDIKEIDDEHVVLSCTCPTVPDVILGDYKSLKYEVEDFEPTEDEIDNFINMALERKADLELKEDGVVENGDTAVIDFEGFKDGVAFEGGKGENYDLVIGSNSFIPGFEDQLIGMKAEEEKDINVTFPDTYHVEDLKGQPVVFKVKVHEIKKKVLPELNDEFVKDLKIENVNTVEEYKNYAKDTILKSKKTENENKADEELMNKLNDICEVEIPDVMINDETEKIFNDQSIRLMYQGIQMDQYLKILGQDVSQFKESLKPSAIRNVKTRLCLQAISKVENIEVSEEDVEKEYEELSKNYNMGVEDVKKYIRPEDVKKDLKVSKALELLKNK